MSAKVTRACSRCGGNDIEVVPAGVFMGFVARCKPCWESDVEAWRVVGAAPTFRAETRRLAIEAWNVGRTGGDENE